MGMFLKLWAWAFSKWAYIPLKWAYMPLKWAYTSMKWASIFLKWAYLMKSGHNRFEMGIRAIIGASKLECFIAKTSQTNNFYKKRAQNFLKAHKKASNLLVFQCFFRLSSIMFRI
jgi:hypothetical protein